MNTRMKFILFSILFNLRFLANPSMNYFQYGLSSSGDELMKSTIFEEDEESSPQNQDKKPVTEDEEVSLPAFPELQYLDISFNLVKRDLLNFKFYFFRIFIKD